MLQTGVVATRLDARPQTGAISVTGIGPLLANPAILAGRVNNNQMRAHANGALAVPVAVTLAPQAGDVFGIMSNGQASRSFWGYSNEFLLFPRDLSDAEHAALMADQSAYHGIALT
jgi:hypothetical protein